MVLNDRTINEQLDKGRIVISPLTPEDIQPASVDPGWKGHLTLDLSNLARLPITLYCGMKIGQISYLRLATAADRLYGSPGLGSKYQGQTGLAASRFYRDFSGTPRPGTQGTGG